MAIIRNYFPVHIYIKIVNFKGLILSYITIPIQIIFLIFIRLATPFLTIRIGWIESTRIGHMAANTEINLLIDEFNTNLTVKKPTFTVYCTTQYYICNLQLMKMWRRRLLVLPRWLLGFTAKWNLMLPNGEIHHIDPLHTDRDVNNFLDKTEANLKFTDAEMKKGASILNKMGIPIDSKYVCLIVRDASYLKHYYRSSDWNYHNFRDANIQNFILAAEALAEHGYYVLRMGAKVKEPIQSNHPMVIDYATSPHRSEFMDIYLGAHCFFCISTGTGFDAIPYIFRRPIAYAGYVPIGLLFTFSKKFLSVTKHHLDSITGKELSLKEILSSNVSYSTDEKIFKKNNITLVDNSPDEIKNLALEMLEMIERDFISKSDKDGMQEDFWRIYNEFLISTHGKQDHGILMSKYSESFLSNNDWWLR